MYKVFFVVLIALVLAESKPTLFDENGQRTDLGQAVENAEKTASGWVYRAMERVHGVSEALRESAKETVQEDFNAAQKVIESTRAAGKQVFTAAKDKVTAIRKVIETVPKTIVNAVEKLSSTPKP